MEIQLTQQFIKYSINAEKDVVKGSIIKYIGSGGGDGGEFFFFFRGTFFFEVKCRKTTRGGLLVNRLRPDRPPATCHLTSDLVSFGVQGVIVVRITLGINNPIQTTCCHNIQHDQS